MLSASSVDFGRGTLKIFTDYLLTKNLIFAKAVQTKMTRGQYRENGEKSYEGAIRAKISSSLRFLTGLKLP